MSDGDHFQLRLCHRRLPIPPGVVLTGFSRQGLGELMKRWGRFVVLS
jgi:hypothetical protein